MNKVFKWLSGRLKNERDWEKLPRAILPALEQQKAQGTIWVMSQEFSSTLDDTLHRHYLGAWRRDDGVWKIIICTSTAPTDDLVISDYLQSGINGPADVIACLKSFEERRDGEGAKRLPQSPATWPEFAVTQGLHLDAKGNIFALADRRAITREATMTRVALDTAFAPKAAKPPDRPMTWERLYKDAVAARMARFNASGADPAAIDIDTVIMQQAGYNIEVTVADSLHDMQKKMVDMHAELTQGTYDVQSVLNYYEGHAGHFSAILAQSRSGAAILADMVNASLLLNVLHAGNTLYHCQTEAGTLDAAALRQIGAFAARFSTEKCGVGEEAAAKIADLLVGAPDPAGKSLPLHRFMAARGAHDPYLKSLYENRR